VKEREQAEGALRQAQRMEAIGQLTGGIAHDFNNLLTVVSGNAALLHDKPPDDVAERRASAIIRAAEQGARLTRQLLAFSRRQTLRPETVDLRQRTHEIAELLSRSLREDIEIAVEIPEDLWPVMVDVSAATFCSGHESRWENGIGQSTHILRHSNALPLSQSTFEGYHHRWSGVRHRSQKGVTGL
jgi:signal transduction histidine kinase